MSFLWKTSFAQLEASPRQTSCLQEMPRRQSTGCACQRAANLLAAESARRARFLRSKGLKKGDRCALLAQTVFDWVAHGSGASWPKGLIVVPLYARQAPAELVAMMKDCSPALICCGDADLRDGNCAELAGSSAAVFVRRNIFASMTANLQATPQLR